MNATISLHRNFPIGPVDPRLFGGFIEHLGRAVYEGIYEPGHPSADADGFRLDVLELLRGLDMPVTRYPGGNFVSGYDWEDGIGPKAERPARLDLAWRALEPNSFGLDEFVAWCRKARTAPMMAVNLGTRGPDAARAIVEYCNHPSGTRWSDLRRANGHEEPHAIKLWCLGNEMDGPWQICHKTAGEYGRAAAEAAKVMKWTDPSIELVACGSSSSGMATFGAWEDTVLDHTYEHVDYLSLHHYFGNRFNETPGFLTVPDQMDRFIRNVVAVCDAVGARKKSRKRIMLSFDEWNVWYRATGQESPETEWQAARPLLEEVYNMEDALAVGGMLVTLLNNADRVKIACIAQSVNVIAPILTEKGGPAWRQTIYHPFQLTSRFGRGTVLRQAVDSPTYNADFHPHSIEHPPLRLQDVPILCSASVFNPETREMTVFAINRHLEQELSLTVELTGFGSPKLLEATSLHHPDLKAVNSKHSEPVRPAPLDGATTDAQALRVSLPKASWNMLRMSVL